MCIYDVAKRCLRLCKKTIQRGTCFWSGLGLISNWHVARRQEQPFKIHYCVWRLRKVLLFLKRILNIHEPSILWQSFHERLLKQKSWESKATEIPMKKVTHIPLYYVFFRVMLPNYEHWLKPKGWTSEWLTLKKGRLNNYRWIPAILVSSTIHNLNFLLGIWRLAFFHAFNFHRLVVDFLSALGGHLHQHVTIQVALGCTIEGCLPAAATVARSKSGGQRCFKVPNARAFRGWLVGWLGGWVVGCVKAHGTS